jgi:hypothetical protein
MTTFSGIRGQFRTLFSVSIVLVVILTMAFGAQSVSAGHCSAPGRETYRVRWGDTLSHIVRLYRQVEPGLRMQDILALPENSEITNPNLIRAGSYICMPFPKIQWGSECLLIHRGDTLSAIDAGSPFDLSDIMMNARIANPDWIFAGETILMPPQGPPPC